MAYTNETIDIPMDLDEDERAMVGTLIVERIIERTKSGVDKNGNPFPDYTETYAEEKGSDSVDLTATGDMLSELSVLESGPGWVRVGYPDDHPLAGQVEGNVTGSYGSASANPSRAREFIGVTDEELELILAKVPHPVTNDRADLEARYIDAILRKQGLQYE